MEEGNIQTPSTPVESAPPAAPVAEPGAPAPNVYGGQPGGYDDAAKALQGNLRTMAEEAAQAKPDTKGDPHQRFGLSEERKHELAAQLKAEKAAKANQPQPIAQTATAAAPAKVKAEKPAVDPIKRATEFVADYFDSEDGDPADLLGRLYDQDYTRYERLVEHIVTSNRDHALRLLGANAGPMASDEQFQHLPEHLRQVAADMDPSMWDSLQFAAPREQIFHLENAAKLQESERQEYEREQEFVARVKRKGAEALERISAETERDYRATLKNLTPFADQKANESLHTLLLNFVFAEMVAEPSWAEWRDAITNAQTELQYLMAEGMDDEAQITRKAIGNGLITWNKAFKSTLKSYTDLLEAEFRDAKLWRESQQKDGAPQPLPAFEPGDQIGTTRYHYRKR